jgi:hypothetical protein
VYCAFTQLFVIFIAFAQLDLLLFRLASDLLANALTLSFYLDGKLYDPAMYSQKHGQRLHGEDEENNELIRMQRESPNDEACPTMTMIPPEPLPSKDTVERTEAELQVLKEEEDSSSDGQSRGRQKSSSSSSSSTRLMLPGQKRTTAASAAIRLQSQDQHDGEDEELLETGNTKA